MTVEEFTQLLKKGLGRAVLFLQDHDATPYREAILYACTHNLAYDRQCEETRGRYLFDIIQQTGAAAFYRDRILAALSAPAEDESLDQLFEIARHFAEQGDSEARSTMIRAFARNAALQEFSGAEEMIALDGLEGFLYVADCCSQTKMEEDDLWLCDSWLDQLEEQNGRDETRTALECAVSAYPRRAAWIAGIYERRAQAEREREQHKARSGNPPPALDYDALRRVIAEMAGKKARSAMLRYRRLASEEALERIAGDLLAEEDPDRLFLTLRLFGRRPHQFQERRFPRNHARLLDLARSENDDIARAALDALSLIRHSTVRELALELAAVPKWHAEVVDLLAANYREGDEGLVESFLEMPSDDHHYHSLGISARNLFEAHPTAAAMRSLILLYENGLCALCRESCVELLAARDQLPDALRAECRYDASLETRALIEKIGEKRGASGKM